jgi:hypothetical protein
MTASDFQATGAQTMNRTASIGRDEASAFVAKAAESFPEPAVEGKWSGRKTLVFILLTCGIAWLAIIAGVMAVL